MLRLALVITEAASENSTPFPPIVYAAIAAAAFIFLAFVVWSFRDAANRHTNTRSRSTGHDSGHH